MPSEEEFRRLAKQEYSYDAWGRLRDPATHALYAQGSEPAMFLGRGYTGHEHLTWFGVVNMNFAVEQEQDEKNFFSIMPSVSKEGEANARLYDPLLGRFLSPDPYVQDPGNTQNFNRYSYALNNPLAYTDPDGEFIFTSILGPVGALIDAACWGAVIGAAGYTASVALSVGGFSNWDWGDFGKAVGFGAASGVLTYGIGNAFGPVGSMGFGGEFGRAMFHGGYQAWLSAVTGYGNPMTAFASAGLGSLGGSAFMMYGGSFASSRLGTYTFSGLMGGVGAELTGGNFWEGATIGLINAGLNHLQQGIKRPNFDDLLANYPTDGHGGDMSADEVYKLIGGNVLAEYNRDPIAYANACAVRTSRALNYAGTEIPKIPGQTLTGADGKNYFFRASDLYKWMSKPAVFGNPNISTSDFSEITGNRGVFIMQAHYPTQFGAWGHATLFNMTGCMGGRCYNGPYAYKYNLWIF